MSNADLRDMIIDQLSDVVDALAGELVDLQQEFTQTLDTQARKAAVDLEIAELRHTKELLLHSTTSRGQIEVLKNGLDDLQGITLKVVEKYKTLKGQVRTSADIEDLKNAFSALSGQVQMALDGGPDRQLLSEALDDWIAIRKESGVSEAKIDTDYKRILDFMAFAGDKPINRYKFLEFQRFANLLARTPKDYVKFPAFRQMSREEAAAFNDTLPLDERYEVLTEKTIDTNYLSPLKMFFRDMAAQNDFRYPLADAEVRISRHARESKTRVPFTVEELNVWFAHAAKQRQGDLKWLPLLGTLTGARVAELIHLQKKDVYMVEGGHWVLDLTTNLDIADGTIRSRDAKTASSRRLIALHEKISELGFIDYVHRMPTGWLFPWGFRSSKGLTKDPADAASKRLNRQLRTVGIHKEIEATFHSTRHTAKDFMRTAKVDQRTHDLQTGHKLKSVSDNYGSKLLKHDEIEVLVALPLPDGLDLSPYAREIST